MIRPPHKEKQDRSGLELSLDTIPGSQAFTVAAIFSYGRRLAHQGEGILRAGRHECKPRVPGNMDEPKAKATVFA
jgi:hypothetical protein